MQMGAADAPPPASTTKFMAAVGKGNLPVFAQAMQCLGRIGKEVFFEISGQTVRPGGWAAARGGWDTRDPSHCPAPHDVVCAATPPDAQR